ncbi:MAG TPA: TIGR00153 family protein [Gammaproteobacteria bacterium]|nr:TIGR00153 family protein [Gammaproteobacteria bacterium]
MAKTGYFSRIFSPSPVTPLQQHMEKVVACVEELIPYFEAVMRQDWDEAGAVQGRIVALEHEADDIKNELRRHLPSSLFMPVDRRDVLNILDLQDHIANRAKDISGLILGRRMALPESLHDSFGTFLARCIDAARQAKSAIEELDELVATGFRGDEVKLVTEQIEKLHITEQETDRLQVELRAGLYAIEKDLPPVDVMFIYEMLKWTGDLADAAQSAGNRLQLMLAK